MPSEPTRGSLPYPRLFSPLPLAGRTLRNRTCLPAALTNFGRDNLVTERWRNYLVERARGGTALLVSEIIAVDPEALAQQAIVVGYDERNDDGFRQTADGVHEAGGCLVGQLWHPGRQQLWHPTRSPKAVSDAPDALSWTVGHVMSDGEIGRVRDAYIAVAARLKACGFAGVELHGAHGYLITQFLSPWSNGRDGAYGGSLAARCRFALEVADGIRGACGGDFIIGLKLPGDEGVDGGIDVAEAERLTAHLAAQGPFDYFAYGQGNFSLSLADHAPDIYYRPGHFLDIHRRMRAAAAGTPVMALGRIGTPELAEKVIAEGYGDLVGMTRAQIADAAFATKARQGRAAEIRPSVFDNFCWGEVHMGKPLAEFHNPHLGEAGEHAWTPPPAGDHRRVVVVVGAGPAGLEAAWVAAARGHAVTLLGAGSAPGGKLRLEAALPGRGEMARVTEHQCGLLERHGVERRLGQTADAAAIRALKPDAVILATGAALRPPPLDGYASIRRQDGRAYVAAPAATAKTALAVLYDHDHTAATYGLADLLASRFERLVLLTPRPQLAQEVNYCSAIGVHRCLYAAGVEIVTSHRPVAAANGALVCENVYTGDRRSFAGVDLMVYVTPRRAQDALASGLAGIETQLVGDCMSPRNLLAAIHEGHAAGLAV